ncbi:MAG: hypothetical protein V4506_12515 [Bacteroidota bacterium]
MFEIDYDNTANQLSSVITALKLINHQIKKLESDKEVLEKKAALLLEHGDEGQKSYAVDNNKVIITTGFIYTLNEEAYLEKKTSNTIPAYKDPVTIKTSYHLNKTLLRSLQEFGTQDTLMELKDYITKKPKKLHIKIVQGE